MSPPGTVPAFIARRLAEGSMHGFLDGSVLHVDVSGFTSMTERMMAHGHRGAERISSSLNVVFGAAVGPISRAGGFIATFAGDSFTAVFPGIGLQSSVETAGLVRDELNRLEPAPGLRPEFRFCLSQGEMEWGITGSPGMRAYFFRGDPVFACSALAGSCEPGELAVDGGEPPSAGPPRGGPVELPASVEESFFPAAALASARKGEFREVVSVFSGFEEDIPYGELDGLTRLLLDEAEDLGGYVSGVFFDDKGGNALTIFGAPLARERLGERALEYVRALKAPGLLGVRFGVCRGMVFAGRIGSRERFTYSVIGDPVNTAAKLLNHAPAGAALLARPEEYLPESPSVLRPAGTVRLEGKSRPVTVAEVVEAAPAAAFGGGRESRLVGRDALLEDGLRAIRGAHRESSPVVVCIYGEAGMGKTSLLSELSSGCVPAATRLLVQCDDLSRRGMGPVARMLEDYLWLPGAGDREEDFEGGWSGLLLRLGRLEDPRAREVEAELERARPALRRLLGLPSGDGMFDDLEPARRYSNTVFAVKALLKALALLSPVLVAVEDLHWADPDTREVLGTLLRRLEGYPLALVVTARPGADGAYPEPEAPSGMPVHRLVLEPLPREDSVDLSTALLGGRPSKELSDFLEDRCRGNPFYLEQYCAYLAERGLLGPSPRGPVLEGEASGMPEGVRSTLLARLDRLPEDLRVLVQTASVLGREFHVDVLRRMTGEVETEALLERGIEQGLWRRSAGGVCSFSHVLIRDAAYDMQLEDSLQRLHAAAARALEEVFGDRPESCARTAFHLERAGRRRRASEYLLRGGRHAAEEYRNEEALDLYGRYLQMAGDRGKGRVEALSAMARICGIMGSWNRAEELFGSAIEAAGPDSERGLGATVDLAGFLRSVGRLEEATGLLEGCGAAVTASGDCRLRADHLLAGARIRMDMGEYAPGMERARRALEIALEAGSTDIAVSACRAIGSAMAATGDSDGALRAYRRALEMLEGRRAPLERAELLGSMGNVHLERQRYDRARDLYAESLELAERAGHRQYTAFATGNLGIVHRLQGRLDRAEEMLGRQEVIGRELGDLYTMATSWMNRALVRMARGRFAGALDLSRAAADAFGELSDRPGLSYARSLSGNLLAFLGRPGEAAESLDTAIELGRKCRLAFYLAEYLVSYAWLMLETGRPREAEPVAREALRTAGEVKRERCTYRARLALEAAAAAAGAPESREALRGIAREDGDAERRALARYALYLAGGDSREAAAARREIAGMGGPQDSTGWRILMGTGGPLSDAGG
jgi:class 3 adenylate cyclase/tetratricopeptide (TPR) repeat protein